MRNLYRGKLEKIYKKINNLALKGRDNEFEYYKYINELIEKGDYNFLEGVLLQYYQIDISNKPSVESYKKDSWSEICFKTNPSFLQKLSILYKKYNIHQQSYDIYLNDVEEPIIGQIVEKEIYTKDAKYLLQNNDFARIIGEKITYLEVNKSSGEFLIVDNYNTNLTFEQNILNQYETAIEFLIS
jgi:hypothetical protein